MFYSKVNDISNAKSDVGDPEIFLSRTIGQIWTNLKEASIIIWKELMVFWIERSNLSQKKK